MSVRSNYYIGIKFLCVLELMEEVILIVSLVNCVIVWMEPVVAFASEICFCAYEMIFRRKEMSPEKILHHIATPISITCALVRGYPEKWTFAVVSFGINLSNGVVCGCKILHKRKKFGNKKLLLFLSFLLCFGGRVCIPSTVSCLIFTDLFHEPNRPQWTRIYATCLLILLFLNFQITFNLYLASRSRSPRCSSPHISQDVIVDGR